MQVKVKSVDELIPYARNSRTHSEEQVLQIASSIREFGFNNPVLIDQDGGIIAGHGRVLAARKIGINEVPTIELSHLTETQKKAYVIADNKIALNAGWDEEMLKLELEELRLADFDIDLTGFTDEEFNLLMDEPETQKEGLTDDDEVPAVVENPITKPGDIWILGNHRVMCGDSTRIDDVEKLMDGSEADCLFTDPPYGYKYESNYQKKHTMLMNDDKILDFMPSVYPYLFENASVYIFGSFQTISLWIEYVNNSLEYKNLIVWEKNNWSMGDLKGSFAGQHELIIFAHKGRVELIGSRDPDIWKFKRTPPENHPTQKPVELVEYALSKVKSGVVLDAFGGSGTTLIACEKTNRTTRLMELDPKYCDVIVKRWQDFTGKDAVLESTGLTFNSYDK